MYTFASFTFPRRIPELPKGTPRQRLEYFASARREGRLAAHAVRYAGNVGSYTSDPGIVGIDRKADRERGTFFYLDSDFMPGLRWQWAYECEDAPHYVREVRGFYTDDTGIGDTIRPLVMRLPHGRGFLAGWSMGKGMASHVDYSQTHDTEREAAIAAHDSAERAAEKERDDQRQELAKEAVADAYDAIAKARALHSALWRGLSGPRGLTCSEEVFDAAIARAKQCRAEVREAADVIRRNGFDY